MLAGVDYLKIREEINPAQIGLIWHSEGGAMFETSLLGIIYDFSSCFFQPFPERFIT
ncbi:MAG: hypothetical protein K8R25_12545 [Methanosarcinales archaeon]|nr:hypothetical protein [Methanosarcinales archaeon]